MISVYTYTPQQYFGSNMYLISSGDEWAVIDPSVEYATVLRDHPEISGKLRYALLTHAHFDHIAKLSSWADMVDIVIVGAHDAPMLREAYLNCYHGFLGIEDGYFGEYKTVSDNDVLELGSDTIRVISTPGHTPGGVCYRIGDKLFVGDTIFSGGGYGRCDLPLGDIDALEKSIIRLITHEADGMVYPGHGESSRLSEIIRYFM